MQVRQLHEDGDGNRTLAVVLDTGDEFLPSLEHVAQEQDIRAASFTAIGAFERATLGFFQWDTKSYKDIPVHQQAEIASLIGNIARTEDGSVKVHAHVVLGTSDGAALAGHVRSGTVRPTLELVIDEAPAHLTRRHDEQTGLPLLDLDAKVGGS